MEAFENDDITSDINLHKPKELLEVKFGDASVDPGDVLTPTQVKHAPKVKWSADSDTYYTLIMNDPDAPSRENPKFREWHHWLVANIPGHHVEKGDVLTEYVGAGPPKGTGLHRYVLLVFKQDGKIKFSEKHLTNKSGDHRASHRVRKFSDKYSLGHPIAGNYFKAEWDSYVPKLYEQLSGK